MPTTLDDKNIDTQLALSHGPRAFFVGRCELPPGINASYKPGGKRNPIIGTEALHQFKDDAALLLSQGYHDWTLINALRISKRKVPLRMEIHFYFKSLWKQDIDGGEKAVIDAVFARLELNDNLVVDKHTTKEVDADNPRVEVEVYCFLPSSH